MNFSKFYRERVTPRSPLGWRFCSLAVSDFVVLSDEIRTQAQWRALTNAQRNDPNHRRPLRVNSFRTVHLIDKPKESADLSENQLDERDQSVDAFDYAFNRLGESAEAGLILTAARAKSGGGLVELPPAAWGIDDFWERMERCSVNPDAPFDNTVEATHWIFFEEDGLGWLVDNERLRFGLKPRYHRRFAPENEQRYDDVYPGKEEARRLTSAWVAMRNGDMNATSQRQIGVITCAGLPVPIIERGSAGRPTSKQVVLKFLEERIDAGTVEPSIGAEAQSLHFLFEEWRKSCPENAAWPDMTVGTIKNVIRDDFNSYKTSI